MDLVFIIKFFYILDISFKYSVNLLLCHRGYGIFNAIIKVAFILFGFEVDTVFKDLFAESILDNTEKVFDVIEFATVFGKS